MNVKSADFISGHLVGTELPETPLAEIAFIGRSNAGKSTLVNRLTSRKKLAITGKKPGTTKQVNFFKVEFEGNETDPVWLADLPGFGYAKLSHKKRGQIAKEVVSYLRTRKSLKLVCLLNDSKRNPEEDEFAIRDLCIENDIRILVVLTKTDRLNQKENHQRMKTLCDRYGLEQSDFFMTGKKSSSGKFWERVMPLLSQ